MKFLFMFPEMPEVYQYHPNNPDYDDRVMPILGRELQENEDIVGDGKQLLHLDSQNIIVQHPDWKSDWDETGLRIVQEHLKNTKATVISFDQWKEKYGSVDIQIEAHEEKPVDV